MTHLTINQFYYEEQVFNHYTRWEVNDENTALINMLNERINKYNKELYEFSDNEIKSLFSDLKYIQVIFLYTFLRKYFDYLIIIGLYDNVTPFGRFNFKDVYEHKLLTPNDIDALIDQCDDTLSKFMISAASDNIPKRSLAEIKVDDLNIENGKYFFKFNDKEVYNVSSRTMSLAIELIDCEKNRKSLKENRKAELIRLDNLLIKIEKDTDISGKSETDVLNDYLTSYFRKNVVSELGAIYSNIMDSSIVCKIMKEVDFEKYDLDNIDDFNKLNNLLLKENWTFGPKFFVKYSYKLIKQWKKLYNK